MYHPNFRVLGISGSGTDISGSEFGYRVLCPVLPRCQGGPVHKHYAERAVDVAPWPVPPLASRDDNGSGKVWAE
jgi:hypothetical protein